MLDVRLIPVVLLGLASWWLEPTTGFVYPVHTLRIAKPYVQISAFGRDFPRVASNSCLPPRLPSHVVLSESNEQNNGKDASETQGAKISSTSRKDVIDVDEVDNIEKLDMTQRKFKAAALRREAVMLDAQAYEVHEQANTLEKKAAKLRIRAWKLEGAVTPIVNNTVELRLKDEHEVTLAQLDLMAEGWIDDKEKWEWYKMQRQLVLDLIGIQKENEEAAEQSLKELKQTLAELQEVFGIVTLDEKGDVTSAGWGFLILAVAIPAWFVYVLGSYILGSISGLFGPSDPFAGM